MFFFSVPDAKKLFSIVLIWKYLVKNPKTIPCSDQRAGRGGGLRTDAGFSLDTIVALQT